MASNRSSDPARSADARSTEAAGWRRRHAVAAALGLALLGVGCAPPAFAEGRLVQVDVVDRDSSRPLHVWRDHGRPVVAGRPGARYAVQVANRSGERVMVVVAIDGVNIMTGETAALDQDGYVLEPYQSAQLTGWRKSHSEVAAFEFTSLADSYAARTGRPDDVGVIGVAVFRERRAAIGVSRDPAAAPPTSRADSPDRRALPVPDAAIASTDAPAAAHAAPRSLAEASLAPNADVVAGSRLRRVPPEPGEHLGTGHGDRETSIVVDTTFDRLAPQPQELVRIRYDSLSNLVAAGIAPRTVAQVPPWSPRAFPGSEPGFVPDPPAR